MSDVDVLVIGGGISGLTTAWKLARHGQSVALWERDGRVGGKIQSRNQAGYLTESAANLVLNFRPEVSRFVTTAGLDARRVTRADDTEGKRYVIDQQRLVAMPMRPLALLGSPLWSWSAKLRLLAEPLVPRGGDDRESVTAFVCRRLGREWLEKGLEPFVAGTLAADPDRANAAATLPRMTGLERRFGSLAAGVLAHRLRGRRSAMTREVFSFRSGMDELTGQLAMAPGVAVTTGLRVVELVRERRGWRVTAEAATGTRQLRARRVVLSIPAAAAATLLKPVDDELARLLAGIDYAPLAVVHLGHARETVTHPLDGTGFLVPRHAKLKINGNLWPSSLFPGRAPVGKVLTSSYVGGSRDPAAIERDDAALVELAQRSLVPLLGVNAAPEWACVDRHTRALPLYYGAYPARLARLAERLRALPGLELVANYRGGVSVRDRILQGVATADRLASQDRSSRAPAVGFVATGPQPLASR